MTHQNINKEYLFRNLINGVCHNYVRQVFFDKYLNRVSHYLAVSHSRKMVTHCLQQLANDLSQLIVVSFVHCTYWPRVSLLECQKKACSHGTSR